MCRATQEATMIDPINGRMRTGRARRVFRSPQRKQGWRFVPCLRCGLPTIFIALLTLAAGCNSLQIGAGTSEKEPSAALPSTAIAGPGKYHHRDSQYVFYSDFPLKTTLPLFKELSELREQ